MAQARVARTGIVDGDPQALREPTRQVPPQLGVIDHRLLLGELDDNAPRERTNEAERGGVGERRRADIYEEQPPFGERAEAGDGGETGNLQLSPKTKLLGPVEPPVGRAGRLYRHPGERLIAHDDLVARSDHRLDHDGDRAGLAQLFNKLAH